MPTGGDRFAEVAVYTGGTSRCHFSNLMRSEAKCGMEFFFFEVFLVDDIKVGNRTDHFWELSLHVCT